jgi:hypothetical protein
MPGSGGEPQQAAESPIDALARLLFLQNPMRVPVPLYMPFLRSTKDLFELCLGLFMRGALAVSGRPSAALGGARSVSMHDISAAEFGVVARAMEPAGIRCSLSVRRFDAGEPAPPGQVYGVNFAELAAAADDLGLGEYVVVAADHAAEYRLSFALEHYLGDRADCRSPVPPICFSRHS